jgi:radical SAM superfamily enzyme YgiQ (UPF0313 family)
MPKIIFIEPKAPNLHIYSQFYTPRLGIFILAGLMRKRGWEAEIICEETAPLCFGKCIEADLVGISTITSTAPRAYMIADRIRSMGVPVLMGGPHVTYLSEEALEHADYVFRGEGEGPLTAFAEAWENGVRDFSSVPSLSYIKDGRAVHNPMSPVMTSLDDLPFPDFSSLFSPERHGIGRRIIPIQTSRGCPFDCAFCSVTGMFGRRFRFRSAENILAELMNYNHPNNYIFFYDDNFTADPQRAKTLLRAMIKENFRFKWSTQVRADVAEDLELVRLMKKAGCHTLFIGLESVNPESLKNMKKKQTVADITRAVRILRKSHIHVHGMFVYGFDEDDWKTVRRTIRFAKKARLTSTQFLILTPLPGSEFYRKVIQAGRILFQDWALYDAHHAVFMPKGFSMAGLQRAQIVSHRKFYSLTQMGKKLFRFQWVSLALAHYARKLNRLWKRRNKAFLKTIELLKFRKIADINVDYREKIIL